MPELKEIYARKKEASSQVSTQTRSLALGMLAVSWALLTVHEDPLKSMAAHLHRDWFLSLAVISVLVLICDMLQYVAITSMADEALSRAEKADPQRAQYDNTRFVYKAQVVLYFTKFGILIAAFLVLAWIFLAMLKS